MTAKTAHQKTIRRQEMLLHEQYVNIIEQINNSINIGDFSVIIETPKEENINRLIKAGYEVRTNLNEYHDIEGLTEISWNKK